jgi:hypothetical protein
MNDTGMDRTLARVYGELYFISTGTLLTLPREGELWLLFRS